MKHQIYQPINCDFYDTLEEYATLKKLGSIRFYDAHAQVQEVRTRIQNLFTKDKEEFMELESGITIRLDQLIALDEQLVPTSCLMD
ncbi:MAG: hypothetical protein HC892_18850 [Saprospiraceae bacterium]|nr:hypothetical protein [Saprospiraceae bacterium]